ncbi:MAG: hypothetical protein ACI84C_002898 [Flavobacteriales bacterium]|jgi:hypothetical protein
MWQETKQLNMLAQIGADLVKDKILIIDYPFMRLDIADSMPKEYQTIESYIAISLDRS